MSERDYTEQYEIRLEEAKGKLLRVSTTDIPDLPGFVEGLIVAVSKAISDLFRERIHAAGPEFDEVDVWDSLEFNDGSTAAERYAREHGVTDDTTLALIRDVGFHQAALRITLDLNDARDRDARIAKMKDGARGGECVDFGDNDNEGWSVL